MTTQTQTRTSSAGFMAAHYRISAALLWLAGSAATWAFIDQIAPGLWFAWLAALAVQYALTALESPLWRREPDALAAAALAIDASINAGGLYVFVTNLDRTGAWSAFSVGLGVSAELSNLAALAVSVGLGVILAAAPEMLLRRAQR
jgi:hypothetical protein